MILLFAIVSVFVVFNRQAYKTNMYAWDASGYYLYLPALFIYHDLDSLNFYKRINQQYHLSGNSCTYGINDQPSGRRSNKYAIGSAVFIAPFFLLAHTYSITTGQFPADGYSYPYQFAGIFSCVFWVVMGLLLLRAFLLQYFTDAITAFTLLCIAFGTNIYCYTVFTPGMSHPYSFFLFAGILYCTQLWYRTFLPKHMHYLGLLLGMVVITRPVNIAVAIIPLFWEVYNQQSLQQRLLLFARQTKHIAISLCVFLSVLTQQLCYWKYTTGQWIYYSYTDEGFNFLHPHIIDGLFSYQKGWFLYTPLACLSLTGLFAMWKGNKKIVPSISVTLLLMIYLVFSWRNWWYGGSFGARPLIEALPIVALPLAWLCRAVYMATTHLLLRSAFTILVCCLVALNMFQTYQYAGGVLHYERMTKTYYWRVFGKTEATKEDVEYLMPMGEYYHQAAETTR